MPDFEVEIGFWRPHSYGVVVEAKDVEDAIAQVRSRFRPKDWNPCKADSSLIIWGVLNKDEDMRVPVPHEDRESRVLMHLLVEAVNAEDRVDGDA